MTTVERQVLLHPASAQSPERVTAVERATGRVAVIDGPCVHLVTLAEARRRHRRAGCVGLLPLPRT